AIVPTPIPATFRASSAAWRIPWPATLAPSPTILAPSPTCFLVVSSSFFQSGTPAIVLHPEPARARDPGAPDPAVAVGVLGQILLVIVLGVIKRRRLAELGGDVPVAGRVQGRLIGLPGRARGLGLLGRVGVDRRAILSADVVALPHALGGIVALPEHL